MAISKSKERILSKIREALAEPREKLVPMPDLESEIYNNIQEDIAVIFAQNFTTAAGKLVYCVSDEDLCLKLSNYLEQEKFTNNYVWEDELSFKLSKGNIKHRTSNAYFIEKVDCGITYCEYLIARTGSILVSTKKGGGRMLNCYPHVHIVCANLSQLVFDIAEGLQLVQEKYSKEEQPSMISLITGPSRTADIEKTLVMGAHGPKELVLFLVDDL